MTFTPNDKRRQRVLVIDDAKDVHRLVNVRLKKLETELIFASDGKTGIQLAKEYKPDLILLDVNMPDLNGFEVCEQIKEDPLIAQTPIIFLTAADSQVDKTKAFSLGAVDYVTKPFEAQELKARVNSALHNRALLDELKLQARRDALTGLPNRKAFNERLDQLITATCSESHRKFAVLFIDLDRFKIINDSLGHEVGDELLITISKRLVTATRTGGKRGDNQAEDIVARLGGDEFVILLDDIPDESIGLTVAQRIQEELAKPLIISGHEINTNCSMGIRFCDEEVPCAQELMRDSDTAMYQAKENGRGKFVVFDDEMYQAAKNRLILEQELRRAIGSDQIVNFYQPIIGLDNGRVLGFEALVRWMHPERGMVSPGDFIPIAEETGLIVDLGLQVLRNAVNQLKQWQVCHPERAQTWVAVNLSKRQIVHPGLLEELDLILEESGIDPKTLKLEVTESVIMHDVDEVVPVLEAIRDRGVLLAIDDFGTGYSSMAQLHQFPIDVLKIDRSFVESLSQSRGYTAIVHAIVTLAHNLNMTVVAEGIEQIDQLVQLQALECDFAQGFYFSKPVPADEAEIFLTDSNQFAMSA